MSRLRSSMILLGICVAAFGLLGADGTAWALPVLALGTLAAVTGLVPDLLTRIARSQLFVAPLVSGTGFRNKVVEALASGTYVIGTPMALEFLDERLSGRLLTAPTAEIFAEQILAFLDNPGKFDQRLRESIEIVREEFLWPVRVRQFVDIIRSLCGDPVAVPVIPSENSGKLQH